MKHLSILLIVLFSLSACTKENVNSEIIVDPPMDRIISIDTLTTGQHLGLLIGKTSSDIYSKIQEMRQGKSITHLSVVGNVFTSLDGLENKIPLYQALLLDESKGTASGIQISFGNDKVSSIYTNNGSKFLKWPGNNTGNAAVSVGDPITDVYAKLVNIKRMSAYASRFERISIFFKDVSKVYDAHMAVSPQWYFRISTGNKRYDLVQLNFKAGVLVSIYSTISEAP